MWKKPESYTKQERVWSIIHKICCELDDLEDFIDENDVKLDFTSSELYSGLYGYAITLKII